MPLNFAYGANMNVSAMALRCPRSRFLGRARLARHRFFLTTAGYASVRPDPRASVHGVLWDLAFGDVRNLDRFEETSRGLYEKKRLPILRETRCAVHALVYIGHSTRPGRPARDYLADIVTAARDLGLPVAYIAHLENLGHAAPERVLDTAHRR